VAYFDLVLESKVTKCCDSFYVSHKQRLEVSPVAAPNSRPEFFLKVQAVSCYLFDPQSLVVPVVEK
jgi:hypothetical protein